MRHRGASSPPMLNLSVQANGVVGPPAQVGLGGGGHLLSSCDATFIPPLTTCGQPLVIHGDGSFVTDQNPARVGETIAIYAVGLGSYYPDPAWPATGYPTTAPVEFPTGIGTGGLPLVNFVFLVSRNLSFPSSAGTTTTAQTAVESSWAGLVPGYVGLYQINVVVPPMPNPSFQCDATFPNQSGNVEIPSDTWPLYICVQP